MGYKVKLPNHVIQCLLNNIQDEIDAEVPGLSGGSSHQV
jgi:hypothetical protein